MAIDMFDTRTMLGVIEEGKNETRAFFRDRFFTNRPTFTTTTIDVDVIGLGGRKIAPFVNPKVGGVAIDRDGYRTESYKAPEISIMRITTAEDMLKRTPGETIYSGKSPEQRAAEQLGRDLRELDDMITRREEIMCAEAILNGQVTIKGEGYDEVLKYWPTETGDQPTTTLATKWNDPTVDAKAILKDLRTLRAAMIRKAGFTPTEIICGTSVVDAILDKLTDAKVLDTKRVEMGQINPQHLPNGVTYWGYLKDSALDIYSYDDWYTNETGAQVNIMPANKFLMCAPGVQTSLAYGLVSLIGVDGVRFYEGARIPDSWVQRAAPAGRVVQIKSRPLPIVHQIYGFHTVTALDA
ncbi:MAG: major capsid protein [Candidatus Spyradenecus sp.]